MTQGDTLLAYLLPMYTNRIEDAATYALVYILNKSKDARTAFTDSVSKTAGVSIEPCDRFNTQVTAPDNSRRPDFVGLDVNCEKRVIGESKFWARLGEGQAKAYLEQLPSSGPAVLLFVVPDTRIDSLWSDVNQDVGRDPQPDDKVGNRRMGVIPGSDSRRIVMVSWVDLLENLWQATTDDPDVESDIKQLQGLAQQQEGSVTFVPLKKEDIGPEFPRRMRGLVDLAYDAISRGQDEGWLVASPGRPWNYGYGRWFNIPSVEGRLWFGLDYTSEESILLLYNENSVEFTSIYLKPDADWETVMDHVVSQLKGNCDKLKP